MMILTVCDNSSMLNAILFIKNIIHIIFIAVPIVLTLFFTIDLAKNVFAKDDNDTQANLKRGIKRIIYSVVLIFVPLIVDTFMGMISNYSKVAKCYDIATEQKVIDLYEEEERNAQKERENKLKEREEQQNRVEQENRDNAAANRQAEQNAQNRTSPETPTNVCENCPTAKKLAQTATKLAWPKGTSPSTTKYPNGRPTSAFKSALNKYFSGKGFWSRASRQGASCDVFIGTTVRASGYDPSFPAGLRSQIRHMEKSNKWKKVNCQGQLSCLNVGDILYSKHNRTSSLNNGHIYMYIGDGKLAQASAGDYFGKITGYKDRRTVKKVKYVNVYRATK